jgi:hypothetical protein
MAILRENLLEGTTVATNLSEGVREPLSELGAEVRDLDIDAAALVNALVHDAGRDFGAGGSPALLSALEQTWESVATVGNALIESGAVGKIVLIAPAEDAGECAPAARAALENLARTLSVEWARYGLTTTSLAPSGDTSDRDLAMLIGFVLSPAGDYFSGNRFDLRGR